MRHVFRAGGPLAVVASLVLVGSAACASAGVPASAGPEPRSTTAYQGVPGFDTRVFPGDSALARWRRESPYRWVGYYLPAPCHTDSSWVGRRAVLQQLGWGSAVVFMGEQDWGAAATVHGPSVKDTSAAAAAAPRCTRANLTAEQGRRDAAAADSAMAAEGFAGGSHVYLDVERVDSVSTPLATYVRAWVGALLERGHYLPALYAHARNADSLHSVQSREYQRRGVAAAPRFWVSGGATPFDVHALPAASGVAYANVWQGASNVTERWGGTSLRIDVNVADAASPSAPTSGGAPAASGAGGQGR